MVQQGYNNMQMDVSDLPYFYENDDDPIQLNNGIEKQVSWIYSVEQSSTLIVNSKTVPIIVERLCHRLTYRFADYIVTHGRIHEWQYLDKPDATYAEAIHGYRYYYTGSISRADIPALQAEIGLMLCFTPDPEIILPYIELASLDTLQKLLADLTGSYIDDNSVNAWLSPPLDAPIDAPQDISNTMSQMRKEVGMTTTRGRVHIIQKTMAVTGVMLGVDGWALTADELEKRKQLHVTRES